MVIKYINDIKKCGRPIEVKYVRNKVYKIFDFDSTEIDQFGLTPREYYDNEKRGYEFLYEQKYNATNGISYFLTPKCFSIGINYIVIEKYEMSLLKLFGECESELQHKIIDVYVTPLAEKLDEMKFVHNDFFPRNIVINLNPVKVALIDFGMSYIIQKKSKKNYICLSKYFVS